MKARPESGIGVQDIVLQAAAYFHQCYGTKFNLLHCWTMIKGCPKWDDLYNSLKNGGDGSKKRPSEAELEEGGSSSVNRAVRPRGHKTTKQDAKHEASSITLEETLKGLIAEKEMSSAKRDERKRRTQRVTNELLH